MNVSVIIPTLNSELYLDKLIERLNKQTEKFKLFVIDSSSTDKTLEVLDRYNVAYHQIPRNKFDHGGTRTMAAKMAEGDILVFMTQDALPADIYAIENIVKMFKNEKVAAVYGRQLAYEDTNMFGKHLREFNYINKSYVRDKKDIAKYGIKTAFLSDSFAAYRKSSLESIGWFKDGLILGEDTYAGAKLILGDYSLAYVSDAKVYHSHSYTIWQEFKRYFDIGVFHAMEEWIIKEFGKAEGEGLRYIRSEYKYLLSHGAWYLLSELFIRNGMKYLGYKMGQKFELLPMWLIKKFSMHHRWWDK